MLLGDEAPKAEPRPVRVDAAGVTYEDPFSWLEEDSPETLAWQAAQNAVAERALRRRRGVRRAQALPGDNTWARRS